MAAARGLSSDWVRLWLAACLGAVLLLLTACGQQQLYTGLSEGEANELISALQTADIGVDKVDQGKGLWAVEVAEGDFPRAVAVLKAQGLPRPKYDNLGTVFKKSGFGDNTTEAQARYVHARQQELMQALRKIDGVVDTNVELSIPAKDRFAEQQTQPSASVLVKYRPDTNLQSRAADIKALVANAVEGLPYDRVNVVMFRADEAPAPVRQGGAWGWGSALVALIALALGAAGVLGYRRRMRVGGGNLPAQRSR